MVAPTERAVLFPALLVAGARLDIQTSPSLLALSGVSVELHVHPGVPHAFEALAPQTSVARRSASDRLRALTGV